MALPLSSSVATAVNRAWWRPRVRRGPVSVRGIAAVSSRTIDEVKGFGVGRLLQGAPSGETTKAARLGGIVSWRLRQQ